LIILINPDFRHILSGRLRELVYQLLSTKRQVTAKHLPVVLKHL